MNKPVKCRCCLSRPPDKREGIRSLYGAMLKECFDIQLRVGVVSGDAGICNVCVKQLDDALDFKTQVLQCQLNFEAVLNVALKGETPNIKTETEDVSDDDHNDISTELRPDSAMSDEDTKTLLDIKQETDLFSNMELTVRRVKPAQVKMKPIPAKIKLVPAKTKPVPAKMKLVPAKTKPVPAKIKPIPAKMKLVPTKTKPVPAKTKPVPAKMKPVPAKQGWKMRYLQTEMSEAKRLQIDAGLLFKYSNATPFQHKTIAGVLCLFCGETLPTMAAMRAHTRDTHENNKIPGVKHKYLYCKMDILDLQCKLCHTDFDLISTLQEHLTQQHNIQFKSVKNYILEFKITDTKTMKCARCDSTFETFKMLQQHMGTHYKNYVCEVCAAGFINRNLVKYHLKIHETGSHKCSTCDKVFNHPTKLLEHEKRSHQTTEKRKKRKCPHCGEMFGGYYARNRHMAQVHNVAAATYKCKVCDREFYLKGDLTMHIKKDHLMERNHKCPICGKEFFAPVILKKHMITHGADKVHKCAVCHKAYARKFTLTEHMRIHNNDRRFQCGVCGLKFVQKCSLKGHMMSTHGLALTDCDSEDGVFNCKQS